MELMAMSAAERHEFTLAQLLRVFVQIASALAFCHENGVVHFNVNPENILLDESCSVAKLSNFGCAHMLDSEILREKKSRATLLYMAPEHFHADFQSDPKLCDIYSFGKTMWKLLNLFHTVELVPFSECHFVHVPHALKELVEQCTMIDPAKRPQSMSEVLERLQHLSAVVLPCTRVDCFERSDFEASKKAKYSRVIDILRQLDLHDHFPALV
jgi:serine/threonine protein kinase